MRRMMLSCLLVSVGLGVSEAADAAGYNPVTQQAQSKLATLGLNPGFLDGVAGGATRAAVQAFQKQSGLPQTGVLDPATLEKLDIGTAVDKADAVADWRPAPTQDELDQLVGNPDQSSPYADYRPNAPAANLDLPGAAILAAMNNSADVFGSRLPAQPKHTDEGYKFLTGCLKTSFAPTNWPDIAIHYYCQMSKPRVLYLCTLRKIDRGRETSPAKGLSRLCGGNVTRGGRLYLRGPNAAADIPICDVRPDPRLQS